MAEKKKNLEIVEETSPKAFVITGTAEHNFTYNISNTCLPYSIRVKIIYESQTRFFSGFQFLKFAEENAFSGFFLKNLLIERYGKLQ